MLEIGVLWGAGLMVDDEAPLGAVDDLDDFLFGEHLSSFVSITYMQTIVNETTTIFNCKSG